MVLVLDRQSVEKLPFVRNRVEQRAVLGSKAGEDVRCVEREIGMLIKHSESPREIREGHVDEHERQMRVAAEPTAVDVASGVERDPGKKDPGRSHLRRGGPGSREGPGRSGRQLLSS